MSNASAMGFGTYPDEPSHYLSGLMIHDYLLSGMKQTPIAYASEYYLHIPMLGIGHWPPFFYVLQAVWMFVAGTSRAADLFLIAIITALAALTVFGTTVGEKLQWPGALLTGGMVLAVPTIRWSNNLVMSDTLAGILIYWAALVFGRFLDSERGSDGIYFGLLASLALMTKPAAGCLALVAILAILLSGKLRLFTKPSLWLAALMVGVLCVPWYITMGTLSFYGHKDISMINNMRTEFPALLIGSAHELSFLLVLSLIGAFALRPIKGKYAVILAIPVAVLGFAILSRIEVEPRLLIAAILPMITLAGFGIARVASLLPFLSRGVPLKVSVLCGLCLIVYALLGRVPTDIVLAQDDGLSGLVAQMRQENHNGNTVFLVAGSCGGSDGRIIAGFAETLEDKRKATLVRAEKILAESDWNSDHYASLFNGASQIINELDTDGISLIAVDSSDRWKFHWPHQDLLIAALEQHPERVQLVYSSNPPIYRLYRFRSERPPQMPEAVLKNLKNKIEHMHLSIGAW